MNPAPRAAIAGGKWLASALSAALSVGITTALCLLLLRAIPLQDLGLRFRVGPGQVGWLLAAVLPLCLLATAIQTYLSTFARSFKEAQTYMSTANVEHHRERHPDPGDGGEITELVRRIPGSHQAHYGQIPPRDVVQRSAGADAAQHQQHRRREGQAQKADRERIGRGDPIQHAHGDADRAPACGSSRNQQHAAARRCPTHMSSIHTGSFSSCHPWHARRRTRAAPEEQFGHGQRQDKARSAVRVT